VKDIVITGVAGFMGRAAWQRYTDRGLTVVGIDDLSRPGSAMPADVPRGCELHVGDVRRIYDIGLPNVGKVIHLAAQTSVTRSYTAPLYDFRVNAEGTLRVALWARDHGPVHAVPPDFVYASTNKVYGAMDGRNGPTHDHDPVDPRTPYGVSKFAGERYVREILPDHGYAFRQSCIYGPGQVGSEDQGWVAHVCRTVMEGGDITCFGDGSQVRDLLHVDDLLMAYDMAGSELQPGTYVCGGGSTNAVSFQQVVDHFGGRIAQYDSWRPHDQRYFVADNNGLRAAGWEPTITVEDGLPAAFGPAMRIPAITPGGGVEVGR